MSTTRTYIITDGPPAHVIWDHAKYSQDRAVIVPVVFATDRFIGPETDRRRVKVSPRISGVQHEDGSGQALNISGTLDGKRFKGYYNARTRSGVIEVTA